MAKIFYDHLTLVEEVVVELDKYQLSDDEKEELVRIVDENMHTEVLHTILTLLPKEKHEKFLRDFHSSPGEIRHLEFLKNEIEDVEKEIENVAKRVKREILAEIKRAKRN